MLFVLKLDLKRCLAVASDASREVQTRGESGEDSGSETVKILVTSN